MAQIAKWRKREKIGRDEKKRQSVQSLGSFQAEEHPENSVQYVYCEAEPAYHNTTMLIQKASSPQSGSVRSPTHDTKKLWPHFTNLYLVYCREVDRVVSMSAS